MALELLIQERGGPTRTQVLPKEIAFFGRREDNDVVLPYTFVSSRHGRVFRRDGSVFVEDMGSTNGILVNGEPVAPMVPRPLRPDDSVEIEKIVIQARWIEEFEQPDAPATYHEATRPVASSLPPPPAASPAAVSPAPSSPAATSVPRTDAPATLWELPAGTARLTPVALSDVLASGRIQQRQVEETDSFALWELFFKGLGIVTMLAGLVLLVVVLLA